MVERVGRTQLVAMAVSTAIGCSGSDEVDGAQIIDVTDNDAGTGGGRDGIGGASVSAGAGGGIAGNSSSGGIGVGGNTGGSSGSHSGGAISSGAGGSGGMPAGGASGTSNGGSAGNGGSPDAGVMPCLDDLVARGVGYVETTARGVVDAVELTAPLNGVLIANGTSTDPATDPIACEFVQTLWDFADLLKARGFNRVGTLGSYCYRCCCAYSSTNFCRGPNDPEPDCSVDGYSNHSWGRAIDIRYYYKADGTRYDINDPAHWVQWTGTGDTCVEALAAQTGTSRELYDLVCEASASRLFSTILTPNYNATHRNHTHLDIGESGPVSGVFIRRLTSPNVDSADYGDD